MARSFWKGKIVIKEFLNPLYLIDHKSEIFYKKLSTTRYENVYDYIDNVKAKRRNHILLPSQSNALKRLIPYYLYNGYDFFKQTKLSILDDKISKVNLSTLVSTRETNVTHKAKLTKAARIKKASMSMKKRKSPSGLKGKLNASYKRKMVLNKKFKKIK